MTTTPTPTRTTGGTAACRVPMDSMSQLMSNKDHSIRPSAVLPASKHELALMIRLAVFPTLTILNLTLGGWFTAGTSSFARSSSRQSRCRSSSTG